MSMIFLSYMIFSLLCPHVNRQTHMAVFLYLLRKVLGGAHNMLTLFHIHVHLQQTTLKTSRKKYEKISENEGIITKKSWKRCGKRRKCFFSFCHNVFKRCPLRRYKNEFIRDISDNKKQRFYLIISFIVYKYETVRTYKDHVKITMKHNANSKPYKAKVRKHVSIPLILTA